MLDAPNSDITNTTVNVGTVVHDEATVAKAAGTPAAVPAPTGTVTFTLYDNGTCNGNVLATDANKPLNGSGVATSATFTTPATAGTFSYRAHYNGDANYPAHDAACEPFSDEDDADGPHRPDADDLQRRPERDGGGAGPGQLLGERRQDRPGHQPGRVLLLLEDHDHGAEPGRDGHAVEHEHEQRRRCSGS